MTKIAYYFTNHISYIFHYAHNIDICTGKNKIKSFLTKSHSNMIFYSFISITTPPPKKKKQTKKKETKTKTKQNKKQQNKKKKRKKKKRNQNQNQNKTKKISNLLYKIGHYDVYVILAKEYWNKQLLLTLWLKFTECIPCSIEA